MVIRGLRNIDRVVSSISSALPEIFGRKRRIVVTYGFAQYATRPVLRPEVPRAIPASANLALMGRPDSTTKRMGVNEIERPMEARENIFRLRKGVVNGPLYTYLSSVSWISSETAAAAATLGLGEVDEK